MGKSQSKILRRVSSTHEEELIKGLVELQQCVQSSTSATSEGAKLEWKEIIERLVQIFAAESCSSAVFAVLCATVSQLLCNPNAPVLVGYSDFVRDLLLPVSLPFLFDVRDTYYTAAYRCFSARLNDQVLGDWAMVVKDSVEMAHCLRSTLSFKSGLSSHGSNPSVLSEDVNLEFDSKRATSDWIDALQQAMHHAALTPFVIPCVRDILRRCLWIRFPEISSGLMFYSEILDLMNREAPLIWGIQGQGRAARAASNVVANTEVSAKLHFALFNLMNVTWMNISFHFPMDALIKDFLMKSVQCFESSIVAMSSEKPVSDLILITLSRAEDPQFCYELCRLLKSVISHARPDEKRRVLVFHAVSCLFTKNADLVQLFPRSLESPQPQTITQSSNSLAADPSRLQSGLHVDQFISALFETWLELLRGLSGSSIEPRSFSLTFRLIILFLLVSKPRFLMSAAKALGVLLANAPQHAISASTEIWKEAVGFLLSSQTISTYISEGHLELSLFLSLESFEAGQASSLQHLDSIPVDRPGAPDPQVLAQICKLPVSAEGTARFTFYFSTIRDRTARMMQVFLTSSLDDGSLVHYMKLMNLTFQSFRSTFMNRFQVDTLSLSIMFLVRGTRDRSVMDHHEEEIRSLRSDISVLQEKIILQESQISKFKSSLAASEGRLREQQESFNCAICSDTYIGNHPCVLTNCGHIYCRVCLESFLGMPAPGRSRHECPLCRRPIVSPFVELAGI
eukprot:ANDGO_04014.mRNA.1 hypothetical protein